MAFGEVLLIQFNFERVLQVQALISADAQLQVAPTAPTIYLSIYV
jgi:hypothetical protein